MLRNAPESRLAVQRQRGSGVAWKGCYEHAEPSQRQTAAVVVEKIDAVEAQEIRLDRVAVLGQQSAYCVGFAPIASPNAVKNASRSPIL